MESSSSIDYKGILVSGLFTLSAVALSFWLIYMHLRNYTKPTYQRHIVRILLLVPIFSLSAWFTYIFPDDAQSFDIIRSCYEAFVIYEFFTLMLCYFGETDEERRRLLSLKERAKLLFPFCCVTYDPKSWYFLMDMKVGTLQYVIIRPLTALIALILELSHLYHGGSMDPRYGFLWLTIINFMSVSMAMYSLVLFFVTIRSDIAEYRAFNKFLSVKFVVFMTFWQSLLIGILAKFNVIPERPPYWSAERTAVRVQSFLLCIEMFIASLWHLRDDCFGYSEYCSTSMTKIQAAILDCFNPLDTIKDAWLSIQHLIVRSRQIARPEHQPVQEMELEVQFESGNDEESLTTAFHTSATEVEFMDRYRSGIGSSRQSYYNEYKDTGNAR